MDASDKITSNYTERYTLHKDDGTFSNMEKTHVIETGKTVPTLGLMMVGLGGNNGSTLTAGLIAHKNNTTWESKTGEHTPNFYGSFTQCATARTGVKVTEGNKI